MAQANWTEFRNGADFGGYGLRLVAKETSQSSFPPGASGNPILHTELSSGGTVPKIWGQLYKGPGSAVLPTKYCAISMAMAGGVVNPNNFRFGAIISPALIGDDGYYQGTPTPDADIDLIMVGFNNNLGTTGLDLWTRRIANGVTVAGGEANAPSASLESVPKIGGTQWRQFEVVFLLNDLVLGSEDFRMMIRYNGGTEMTPPGSVGWSDWEQIGSYDYNTEILGVGIDLSSGFYPGFGFQTDSTSTNWYGGSPYFLEMEVEDVIITNYEVIPP